MKPRPPHRWLALMTRRDGRLALYCNHPSDYCDWTTGYVTADRWPTACRAALTHIKEQHT